MTRLPLDPVTIEACARVARVISDLVDSMHWRQCADRIERDIRSLASEQQGAAPDDKDARIYPCDRCGKMRSKNEGGTVFTVCDTCWDEGHRAHEQPPPAPMGTPLGCGEFAVDCPRGHAAAGDACGRVGNDRFVCVPRLDAARAFFADTRATRGSR